MNAKQKPKLRPRYLTIKDRSYRAWRTLARRSLGQMNKKKNHKKKNR